MILFPEQLSLCVLGRPTRCNHPAHSLRKYTYIEYLRPFQVPRAHLVAGPVSMAKGPNNGIYICMQHPQQMMMVGQDVGLLFGCYTFHIMVLFLLSWKTTTQKREENGIMLDKRERMAKVCNVQYLFQYFYYTYENPSENRIIHILQKTISGTEIKHSYYMCEQISEILQNLYDGRYKQVPH